MSEFKDPTIKLFGQTIELPETDPAGTAGEDTMLEDGDLNGDADEHQESLKRFSGLKKDDSEGENEAHLLTWEGSKDSNMASQKTEDAKTNDPSTESDVASVKAKPEEEPPEIKKPDKILTCPRCNSIETKFCYFNNYNVNQPRHFCKNCQRYWTAGGTMRNVPVGAGRRKNKNSISQFRHLNLPEGARLDFHNGIQHPVLNHNGTILTFTSDSPLCESMASVLNIAEKRILASHGSKENRDDKFSNDELGKTSMPELTQNCHQFPPQVPCFTGIPYLWNSIHWSSPASPTGLGFPVPFVSPAQPYWGAWNVPLVIPTDQQPSPGPNSPTLGKHSRDHENILKLSKEEKMLKEINSDKCLWAPKTLRFDEPGEAAKSSIWTTLGIKNDKADSVVLGGGLFKAFQSDSKSDAKTRALERSSVLQANPAALSRSLSFHESS